MQLSRKIAAVAGALALMSAPAFAQVPDNQGTARAPETTPSETPPSNEGTAHKPATPGPGASAETKAKAYGKHCADQSKKHVKGEKGTAFSRCVTAMAKLASGQTDSPRTACKELSKKRAEGEKRSAFSKCVSEGAKLLREE